MQRKIFNIFLIYKSEHLIKHKKLLVFSFETKLKIQLTTKKKSDFRSWKKGSYDDDFDVDWVTWTELKVAWGCSRLYTATQNDKRQLDKAPWKFTFFTKRNLLVSQKILWKKHSLKIFLKARKHGFSNFFVHLLMLALR